ncbi:MAG TPA: PorV/PorQ family protein [bacterium]|nr:PorV/PorQ family protein [bacterium]
MRKFSTIMLFAALSLFLLSPTVFGQVKLAQTGFQFLSVGIDARATGMGEAFTTIDQTSSAIFYNPAGMASINSFADMSFSSMTWIADIKYNAGTLALSYDRGRYGVLGISFLSVDYGEFEWTQVAQNEQGFEDIGELIGNPQPNAHMFGLSYARQLTDRFSVGGTIKYVYHDLGSSFAPVYTEDDTLMETKQYDLDLLAFDFGTIYRTGFKSLIFGMTVRNFSQEVKYEKEGFQLPLTFKIGVSMNAFDLIGADQRDHSLFISLDAVHPRSYSEYLNIGGEYVFMDIISLRGGYISSQDEYDFTYGIGFKLFGLAVDYSYVPYKVFDDINRVTFKFEF